MITCNCPSCGLKLAVPDEYAGQTGACKKCGARITVPPLAGAPPPIASAPESERISDPQEIERLLKKINPPSWQVWVSASAKREAVLALGDTGSKDVAQHLLRIVQGEDESLSTAALESLAKLKASPAVEVRVTAVAAIGAILEMIKPPIITDRAIELLVDALEDGSTEVRKQTVRAINRATVKSDPEGAEPSAMPLCRQALLVQANSDPSEEVRREAATAWASVWVAHPHWDWQPQSPVERRISVRGLLLVIESSRDADWREQAEKLLVNRIGHHAVELLREEYAAANDYMQDIIKRLLNRIGGRQSQDEADGEFRKMKVDQALSEQRRQAIADSLRQSQAHFEEQSRKQQERR